MSRPSHHTRKAASPRSHGELRVIEDAVCLACGCLCDDITLTVNVEQNRITHAANACPLGEQSFLAHIAEQGAAAMIDGQPARYGDAIVRAAEILRIADAPLVEGLAGSTSESQRIAVAIADRIGASLDTATTRGHAPTIRAMQLVGEVTCTLGELRHRADLLIYWGCDPVTTHPRHLERYSLDAPSERFLRGRGDRYAVLIAAAPVAGDRENATAKEVNQVLSFKPGGDFELAWVLRALAKGVPLKSGDVLEQTGLSLDAVQQLFERMRSASYGGIVFGRDATDGNGGHRNALALLSLTRDMNRHTRFVASPLRGSGNVSGADNVLTWSTGYPFGVQFGRGYPRYSPGEFTTTELLSRREIDAALLVGVDSICQYEETAREHLLRTPFILIGPSAHDASSVAAVTIRTATTGLQTSGTVYRADEITLPLRPALTSSFPSETQVLEDILRELESLGHG